MAFTRQNLTLNTFYKGIQQDDVVGSAFGVIESKNIDWIRTWYWATLWPKSTKQILTSTTAMRVINWRSTTWATANAYAAWDWGNIYRLNGVDSAPTHTLASWNDIFNWLYYKNKWEYFFLTEISNNNYSLWSVWAAADSDNWTSVNESIKTNMISSNIPPMITSGTFLYVWYWTTVLRIDSSWTQVTQSIFQSDVVWITQHWTQFYVYSSNWNLSLWDWVSSSVSANVSLWFRVRRVKSKAWLDYVTSETGESYIVSGYSAQLLSESKQSNRLNDNSQYVKKLDFSTGNQDTHTLEIGKDDLYLISQETQPGIYKYWDLIPWTLKGFHKIATEDNTTVDITNLYSIYYSESINTLYFAYNQWSVYWVDKLELDNLTTAQDWYFVTQVFRWPANKVSKIERIRFTTSYTSWDNYIKFYKRLDNWSWTLFSTINDTTDVIERHEVTSEVDDFIDIQFKIEIHNDLQTNTPPILHWFELTYTVIED